MPPPEAARLEGPTRSLPRALLWIAAVLLIARVAAGLWEQRHPPPAVDLVQWEPVASAVAKARTLGRPLLYEFSAAWCGPCQQMAREVFADRRSAQIINAAFVPVRLVDRQREEGRNPPDVAALQERYHVQAFPTLVVVSPDGGEPMIIEGYAGRAAVMKSLTEAAMKSRLNLRIGPSGVKPDPMKH